MTPSPSLPTARFIPVLLLLTSISACAPSPATGPFSGREPQLQQVLQLQKQQGEQIQALTEQLAKLQELLGDKIPSSSATELTQAPESLPEPASAAITGPTEIPPLSASAAAFRAAFTDLASGRFSAAEDGFTNFLSRFSDHRYAVNARYWLADAQSAQHKWALAANNLRQILADPGGGAKAPATLLKLARIYDQQGMTDNADQLLEQLRTRYPDSLEAQHFSRSEPTP